MRSSAAWVVEILAIAMRTSRESLSAEIDRGPRLGTYAFLRDRAGERAMTSRRCRIFRKAILIAAFVLLGSGPGGLASANCGQPLSDGDSPQTRDALATLRASIGLVECDTSVCDVDSDCIVSVLDAFKILKIAIGVSLPLGCDALCSTPAAPSIISPRDGASALDPADVHMEAEGFSDPDAGDEHLASDWEIWDNETNTRVWAFVDDRVDLVHTHFNRGSFLATQEEVERLEHNRSYRLRVRFHDSYNLPGPWSEWVVFQTASRKETIPMRIEEIVPSPEPSWTTDGGEPLPVPNGVTSQIVLRSTDGVPFFQLGASQVAAGLRVELDSPVTARHLGGHERVRVEISSSHSWTVPPSVLRFVDLEGEREIWLPEIALAPGPAKAFWPTEHGETYFGSLAQAAPNFETLARALPNPFRAISGYRVERIATGFSLPTSIAIVPDRGSQPTDPWFYVTELSGNVQVVLNNGTTEPYYEGLLDYDPNEDGRNLAGTNGACIEPNTGDLFITSTWRDAAEDELYNRVIRFHSSDGGRSADDFTEIFRSDERVGGHHQVQWCRFGPDGKLYVHIGDGIQPTKARRPEFFYGKILRMNSDGSAPTDNPFYDASNPESPQSLTFAVGFRNAFDADFDPAEHRLLMSDNGSDIDRLAWAEFGSDGMYEGSDASFEAGACWVFGPPAVSPRGIQFNHDDVFPNEQGRVLVTIGNKKQIVSYELNAAGSVNDERVLAEHVGTGYATVLDLEFADDGLYLTPLFCNDCTKDTRADRKAGVYRITVED